MLPFKVGRGTLMIIQSLIMSVTMAYKVLGASKRDHILKSLDRAELNEEISEDKPDVRSLEAAGLYLPDLHARVSHLSYIALVSCVLKHATLHECSRMLS
ncbi:unnamed protein product [Porites lobata]|uniref:Uncharacterized protein n=1 Tax=Porites lobata TaxID=104759 RepID=A0ABN8QGD5_9CNID|nr:unnamed protein product [Porites lobata]